MEKVLDVANIKCSGCAHSITTRLEDIEGISNVYVSPDNGTVKLAFTDESILKTVLNKLSAMGYPEATEENGLLMKAKSYANCMIGKATK